MRDFRIFIHYATAPISSLYLGVIPLKKNLDLKFCSELLNVKNVVKKTLLFLQNAVPNITTEEQSDLRLVFSELLYNAVVHGNQNDINKNVHLNIEIDEGMVVGRVADEGDGFNYLELLEHIEEEDVYNECGRGIRLVYSLTDKIVFNIPGNAVRFYKRVANHG